MIFSLPMPPSINKAYITAGKYRRLSPIAREWYKAVAFIIPKQLEKNKKFPEESDYRSFISKMVRVRADFYFKYPKKCDTSNYVKLLWDAFQKNNVIKNDNMIYEEKIVKFQSVGKEPHVDIHLEYLREDIPPDRRYAISTLYEGFKARL
jgi:Holliday junction resolvase RusA-like endonuclease